MLNIFTIYITLYKMKDKKVQSKKRNNLPGKTSNKVRKKNSAGYSIKKSGKKQGKDLVKNLVLIDTNSTYTRIACLKKKKLSDLYIENKVHSSLIGGIFKAKVIKKYLGLKACFVNIGMEQSAFLYMGGNPRQRFLEKPEEYSEEISKETKWESLKEGQMLTVQVIKDSIKGKNVRVSLDISLPGRNLVYLPNSSFYIGLSRHITENREQLKEQISQWNQTKGLILRTLAEGVSDKALKMEWESLQKLWESIQKKLLSQKKPGFVWSNSSMDIRFVRDVLTDDFDKVLIDDKLKYKAILEFVSQNMPKFKKKISFYDRKDVSLFNLYDLESAIDRLLNKTVWLKSGGFIVIEETEAAVVIDVNTGRFIGKKSQEENILKTNLEAAQEIALQLKLRSCGGIILIDFIDMETENYRQKLMDCLQEELSYDRVYTQVFPISELGVVQMTRKKEQPSLKEILCEPCSTCEGRAYVKKS